MAPLSIQEVLNHSDYDSVVWDLEPAQKGRAQVANGRRGGPFKLAYEVHGEGPLKLVFIIGLGGWMSAWQRQTKDFGHSLNTNRGQSSRYSVLVFDNRGMGQSDKPLTRYSTSEMALDVLELVDQIDWRDERQLHVIGSSMGGMIAQEIAMAAPERIASLTLQSSAPKIFNTVGWLENLRNRISILIPKDIAVQIEETKHRLLSEAWLSASDEECSFPSNGDRYAAIELHKRRNAECYSRKGFLLQVVAAGWHHKSPEQLKLLGDQVGRERIQVIHGTVDRMVTFPHGELLAAELGGPSGGLTFVPVEGKAHALQLEWRKGLTRTIAALIDKTEAMR